MRDNTEGTLTSNHNLQQKIGEITVKKKNLKSIICFILTVFMLSLSVFSVCAQTQEVVFEVRYVQTSNVVDGKYMIRFVGLSSMADVTAGMSIRVWETESDTTFENFDSSVYTQKTPIKSFYTDECKFYDELEGYEAGGIAGYKANEYGAEKFFAVAIDNVKSGMAYTFEVTPFYMDGNTEIKGDPCYALFDEDGNYLNGMTSGFADTVAWSEEKIYKAMSINAGSYTSNENISYEERMNILVNYINSTKPDSIAVQEYGSNINSYFKESAISGYTMKYFDYYDSTLGSRQSSNMPFFYNSDKFTVNANEGGAISIWAGDYLSNGNAENPFSFSWMVLRDKTTGNIAYIHANLHLYSGNDISKKIKQVEDINKELDNIFDEYSNAPIIITGDYNTRITDTEGIFTTLIGEHPLENAIYIADVAEDETQLSFPDFGESSTLYAIDHALVNENVIDVKRHDIVTNDEWSGMINASDHYPLVITFGILQ